MRILTLFALFVALYGCGGGGGGAENETFTVTETVPVSGATVAARAIPVEYSPNTFNQPTSVTQTEQDISPIRPDSPYINQTGPSVVIELGQNPDRDLVARFPDPGGDINDIIPVVTDGIAWYEASVQRENNEIVVTLKKELAGSPGNRPVIPKLTAFLSRFSNVGAAAAFLHLAGQVSYANPAIIIHGYGDRTESFRPLAQYLVTEGIYSSVFAYQYDWTKATADCNDLFVAKLNQIYQQTGAKNVDVIAHSRGGVMTRYTLEIDDATAAVNNCFYVGSPNTGTGFGQNVHLLTQALRHMTLNNPFGWGLAKLTTPALQEMLPGSSFLSALNSFNGQTGRVNYHFFAQQDDTIVDTASATAEGIAIEELTGGIVTRQVLPGGHSYLVKDSAGIAQLADKIRQIKQQQGQLDVTVTAVPQVLDPEPDGRHWLFTFRINYSGPGSVNVQDVMTELYGASGSWVGTWWLDPSTPGGAFFPEEYTPAGITLSSGETFELEVAIYAGSTKPLIAQAPPGRQRQTGVLTVRYNLNGEQRSQRVQVQCRFQGQLPALPETRRPTMPNGKTAGFGPVSG